MSIAWPIVAYGCAREPFPAMSLPMGDTKTPNASPRMQGSPVTDGVSTLGKQSPWHAWYPVSHATPHAPPPSLAARHAAFPCVDEGGEHATAQPPQ
jgi:hypothetical protein